MVPAAICLILLGLSPTDMSRPTYISGCPSVSPPQAHSWFFKYALSSLDVFLYVNLGAYLPLLKPYYTSLGFQRDLGAWPSSYEHFCSLRGPGFGPETHTAVWLTTTCCSFSSRRFSVLYWSVVHHGRLMWCS